MMKLLSVLLFGSVWVAVSGGELLKNTSYLEKTPEATPVGWELRGEKKNFIFQDSIAMLDNRKQTTQMLLIQRNLPLKADTGYCLSFMVRGEGAGIFSAYAEWIIPAKPSNIWRNAVIIDRPAGSDWRKCSIYFTPKKGVANAKIVLRAEKNSFIMFSGVKLEEALPPDEYEILPALWKGAGINALSISGEGVVGQIANKEHSLTANELDLPFSADETDQLTFLLEAPARTVKKLRVYWRSATMNDYAADRFFEFPVEGKEEPGYYSFKLPDHPYWTGRIVGLRIIPGYECEKTGFLFNLSNVKLLRKKTGDAMAQKQTATASFDIPAPVVPENHYPADMFNRGGALLVDGTPQFILGGAPIMQDNGLQELEEAGFNHLYLPGFTPPEWVLEELMHTNLKIQGDFPWRRGEDQLTYHNRVRERMERLGKFRPLVAYYMSDDEPTWRKIPLAVSKLRYDALKELSPRLPVYLNHAPRNSPDELRPYAEQSDIVCVDIYPVPVGYHSELKNKTMSCVGEYADKTRSHSKDSQPLWIWLQAYSRGGYPTLYQTRFMAYNAIMHGAMGILYYGINHLPFPDNPMWPILKKFGPELRSLNDVLIEPWSSPLLQNSGVEVRTKKIGDEWVIFVANTVDSRKSVVIKPAPGCDLFYDNFTDKKIPLKDGKLTFELAPYEVKLCFSSPRKITSIQSKLTDSKLSSMLDGNARYIWHEKHRRNVGKTIYFRRVFELDQTPLEAGIFISGDDNYNIFCNGKAVGGDFDDRHGGRFVIKYHDLAPYLVAGKNWIAVESRHDNGNAGIYAEFYSDKLHFGTDSQWRCFDQDTPDWNQLIDSSADWTAAKEYGKLGEESMTYFLRYFLIHRDDADRLSAMRRKIAK